MSHYDSPSSKRPHRRHRMSSSGRSSSEMRRRKSRRRRESIFSNMTNALVVAGTVIMFIVYLGFLGFSMVKKPRPQPAPPPAPAPIVDDEAKKEAEEQAARDSELKLLHTQIANLRLGAEAAVKARGFRSNKNTAKAHTVLDEALARTPDVLDLHFVKATLLFDAGAYDEAKNELFVVLKSDPNSEEAKALLAQTLIREGHDEAAIALAKWIIETDTYSLPAHRIIATAYMHSDRAALALPYLRKIVQLDPDNTISQNDLARAQIDVGDYTRAARLLEATLTKDDQNSVTYYNLAACYALQGNAYESLVALKKAVEKYDPSFVAAWLETEDFAKIRDTELLVNWIQQLGITPPAAKVSEATDSQPAGVN